MRCPSERELLAHIYGRSRGLPRRFARVLVGPGDDCAVVAAPGGGRVLLKVDQLVSGVHFTPYPRTPIDLIARKCIARAVSDIAAMGGEPLCGLAGATLARSFGRGDELFDAMARWAERFGCPLVGGDIAVHKGDDAMVLALSVVGEPHAARGPVLRAGARVGDGVYVTGRLGGSYESATGLGRHLTFEPRLAEARWLCDVLGGRLHAMMDVSDGVGIDASRLAEASGVSLRIEAARLPLAEGLSSSSSSGDWRRAAGDGEDYELLFAAEGDVPGVCPATGTPVTRIGGVREAGGRPACEIVFEGGVADGAAMGFVHGQ